MNLAKLLPLRAAMRQVTETIKRKRIKEKENKSEKTREREREREAAEAKNSKPKRTLLKKVLFKHMFEQAVEPTSHAVQFTMT